MELYKKIENFIEVDDENKKFCKNTCKHINISREFCDYYDSFLNDWGNKKFRRCFDCESDLYY